MRAAVIVLVMLASTAAASPTQDLERARSSFKARDWQSAKLVLKDLLYPNVQFGQADEAFEARILLGASFFELGERESARDEFEKALEIDPQRSITTLTFSEGAVRLFDQTKEDMRARLDRDAERKRLAEAAEKLEEYRKSLVVYETRPFYLNFLPFGLAQFAQKRNGAGAVFALGQGATFVANVGIYTYLVRTYGFTSTSVPITEGPTVRRLQQLQIGTGVAFLGLYAWGVFDAIRHYKPRQQVQGDDSLIPKELLDSTRKPAPRTSLRERLQIGPMLTPTSVGLGIGWEN